MVAHGFTKISGCTNLECTCQWPLEDHNSFAGKPWMNQPHRIDQTHWSVTGNFIGINAKKKRWVFVSSWDSPEVWRQTFYHLILPRSSGNDSTSKWWKTFPKRENSSQIFISWIIRVKWAWGGIKTSAEASEVKQENKTTLNEINFYSWDNDKVDMTHDWILSLAQWLNHC